MRHKAQEGPNAAAARINQGHALCTRLHRSPQHRRARPAASVQRLDRTGTPGERSWHAFDGQNTQAAPQAASDCLRRRAGRHVVWVHTEGGCDRLASAVRVRLPWVQSVRLQRSSLLHHSVTLHSTRRRAPEVAALFLTSSSSATSFRQTDVGLHSGLANRASSRPLWSPIWADGQPAACCRGTRHCLRLIVRFSQI